MALNKITVLPGQSIWDIAVQHMGSVDAVKELILLNPDKVNFNDSLVPGTELIIGEIINQKVVDFFAAEVNKPATADNTNLPRSFNQSFNQSFR